MVTATEWAAWQEQEETKLLLEWMHSKIKTKQINWSQGDYEFSDGKNLKEIGKVQMLAEIIDLQFSELKEDLRND